MMKVICCRFSPSRWKIARRCSSRLFSAKERKVSARAISRRSLRPLSANKLHEEICNGGWRTLPACSSRHLAASRSAGCRTQHARWVRSPEHTEVGGSIMPYYQKLGEMPRKHHIWFSRDGAGPGYKNEGIYYEHVVTTEGFNEAYSIMYHLRPPTRVRNVKLLKCEELKKITDSPLRHHHLKTADIPRKGDLYTGRIPILFNQDVIAYRARPAKTYDKFEYYKNGGADEIIFVFKGGGILESVFGEQRYR